MYPKQLTFEKKNIKVTLTVYNRKQELQKIYKYVTFQKYKQTDNHVQFNKPRQSELPF